MKLTRKKALDLLPSIVDGEAGKAEVDAFFAYIEKDDVVRKQYESLKIIKQVLRDKCPRKKAPDHLRNRIKYLVSNLESKKQPATTIEGSPTPSEHKDPDATTNNTSQKSPVFYKLVKPMRYVMAAAVILFLTLITIELLDRTSTGQLPAFQNLEEVVFNHFENTDNQDISLTAVSPVDINHAAEFLESELSYSPRMPLFGGAEISQVIYADFTPNFKAPVLEFHQEENDEYIYVFAFKVDELENNSFLRRDPEAVKHCQTYDDYHIREVAGKHVVSWKWGDYWYAAVSNHNGHDVISLVEPMEEEINSW